MARPDPEPAASWCRTAFLTARHGSRLTSSGSEVGFHSRVESTPHTQQEDINIMAFLAFGRINTTPPDRNREQLALGRVQGLT